MRILACPDCRLASHTMPLSTSREPPLRGGYSRIYGCASSTPPCRPSPTGEALPPTSAGCLYPFINYYLSIIFKNYHIMRGHAVKGGRSAWYLGGSAPAVRARASHDRGVGGLLNGSCASSVCTPFAATSAAIGSGASASAGARTLGASRPRPEGACPLLVLSSSPAAGVLGSLVYLGLHGEGVFAGGFFAAFIATAVAAEGHRGQVHISWE